MKSKVLKKFFLKWLEGDLSLEERKQVAQALEKDVEMQRYYQKMTTLLTPPEISERPCLAPNPFLKTRIQALLNQQDSVQNPAIPLRYSERIQWTFSGLLVITALSLGIWLGSWQNMPTRFQEGASILSSDSQTFFIDEMLEVWESVVEQEDRQSL